VGHFKWTPRDLNICVKAKDFSMQIFARASSWSCVIWCVDQQKGA